MFSLNFFMGKCCSQGGENISESVPGSEGAPFNSMLGQPAGVLRLVLELVVELLHPRDMKNVVLVCRLWREVGEVPHFWAWVVLGVTMENMSTMSERLGSRRLQAVRKLWVV